MKGILKNIYRHISKLKRANPPANSRNVKRLQEKKIKRGRFTNFR